MLSIRSYSAFAMMLLAGFTAACNSSCPPAPAVQETSPGFPVKITLAEGTRSDVNEPVHPTSVFKSNSTFHAVVRIENAPDGSRFAAAWFALDTGGVAPCNSAIDSSVLESGGTRNLDFTLAPRGEWPAGTYQVQIVVDGQVAVVQNFSVQ